ncbi:MAG: patatin-like phospholipase family protein [Limnohabitans sp.]
MRALCIHAGPQAMAHIRKNGLGPQDISVIPGAAGGPKGLILGPIDRYLFDQWLPRSQQPIDLVGASIGAWRMATACLPDPRAELLALEEAYVHQNYVSAPGQNRPTPTQVSDDFSANLHRFYAGRIHKVLQHPRYRLHVMTSHGLGVLHSDTPVRLTLGYAGAYLTNLVNRKAMSGWLERVVFSSSFLGHPQALPFRVLDYRTRQIALTEDNFLDAVQASCSIPFVLNAVHDIAGAPKGAYWDGGITDYHLHLDYRGAQGLTLYPHFQQHIVPGWLDKKWSWRHVATPFLDTTVVLSPHPDWVKQLPNGKLPDRSDFITYKHDLPGRVKVWQNAVAQAGQLADELAQWLLRPDPSLVQPL